MRRSSLTSSAVFSLLLLTLFAALSLWSQTQKAPVARKPATPAATKPAPSATTTEDLDALYNTVMTGDWDKAKPAVDKIGKLDAASKAKLLPRFMNVLDNEDAGYTVMQAVAAMGAQALPDLLKAAQNETGKKQQYAVGAIGEMEPKAKSAIPVLIKLSKTTDKDLRGWVIGSLGKIGSAGPAAPTTPQAIDILMAAFNDDVAGCQSALANYGAPVVPGLRKVLQSSTDTKLKGRAAKTLMFMGPPAAPAVPELTEAAKNPELRETALYALVKIGPGAKPAMPVLKKVVMKDPEYWTAPKGQYAEDRARKYAMEALGNIGTDPEFLLQAAKDGAPGADASLSKLGAPVVPLMKKLLIDPDPKTRKIALSVLHGVGPKAEPVIPELILLMGDKEYVGLAISTLGSIGPAAKPAVPALISVLLDENQRYGAMEALKAIGPAAKDAVPYLIDILEQKPKFSHNPPPPGYTYKYGEKLGEIGRIGMKVMDEMGAEEALKAIGTPEALAAIQAHKEKKEAVDPNENLFDAVSRNHVQRVKTLLAQGADPNKVGGIGLGWMPLHVAKDDNNAEVARLLLAKGADPNGTCNASKQTPLMLAADNGNKNVVLALLEKGANPNARDDAGFTVLLTAIESTKAQPSAAAEIVRALLDKGADPNAAKDGWTPIMYASARGKTEIAKLLLQKNANVNVVKDGKSALSLAGNTELVKILKAAGAK